METMPPSRAEICLDGGWTRLDYRWRALDQELAEVEHGNSLGERHDNTHFVLNQDYGQPSLVERANHVHQPLGLDDVQPRVGLVQQ